MREVARFEVVSLHIKIDEGSLFMARKKLAMREKNRLETGLITRLGLTGVVMGLLTALVGLPPGIEPLVWVGAYALWVVVVTRRRTPRPLVTVLLASVWTGVLTGLVQGALQSSYIANNPWYAEEFASAQTELWLERRRA